MDMATQHASPATERSASKAFGVRPNGRSVSDMRQRRKPAPRLSAPVTTGTMTPKRSASRPIRMPPTPKPTIVSVYGSDASARETPNSACRAGSATTTPYMAAPPMVMSSSAAPSLTQAYSDSASPLEEVLLSFIAAEINPKNPETHHGRPLQPVFDHQPGARRLSQLRGHLWRAGERRHARGDRRGDHPSRLLRGLAQRRHRRAARQAGLRRTQAMSRSRVKTVLLH